jgi:hypothetical protein
MSKGDDPDDPKYSVGYRRPPVASRYKPGTSGNPRGRPKGRPSLRSAALGLYAGVVTLANGVKIELLTLLLRKQLDRGLKGSDRAAQDAIKRAEQLGAFDEPPPVARYNYSALTDDELEALARLVEKLEKR